MSSNQLNAKLMMLITNTNNTNNINNQNSNINNMGYDKKNKSTDKVRESSNQRGEQYQNQAATPLHINLQNKSPQRPRNSASSNKMQNRSNQNSQQAIQFTHMRANSQNDMQHIRKNLTPNMMQNYSTKNPIVLDSQVLNGQQRNEFQDDIKRIMNNQINSNLVQTGSGVGQKGVKKTYQQIKVAKNNSNSFNGSNSTNNNSLGLQIQNQQIHNQQQQATSYNIPSTSNSNNIIQFLNDFVATNQTSLANQANHLSNNNNNYNNNNNNSSYNYNTQNKQQNQENVIQSEIKNSNKTPINSQLDLNDMKKSLSDIKLPKLSSQLKKKVGVPISEQPRSQSTQPSREQQVIIRNKNNESTNGNLVMQTEASVMQNEIGSSQLLNRISQTYDIQQKMITDIENIDYVNGKGYSYQKSAKQQLSQQQMNGDSNPNNTKRPTQSTIYKQLQQSKYNNRQNENNNQAHSNILKQSFQISLPIKMQIEKQLQQQKQSSTLQTHENNRGDMKNSRVNEGGEDRQNTIEIVGLNQQQKLLIQKNNSNIVAQSVDSNFKNYLKSNKKKNVTPDPVRMSADSIYNSLNQARIQNEADQMDAKTLQNTLNQFRVRSQTPNGNLKSSNTNSNQFGIQKKTHTPISSSNLQQNDFNSAMNNLYSVANQNINEYIVQNSSKQSKQQSSSNIKSTQANGSSSNNNSQVHQFNQNINPQQQPLQKINNYEYNLNYNSIPDNQNFRHKTPIKLKLTNNSLIKVQKVQITDEREQNDNLRNSKQINSSQDSNNNNNSYNNNNNNEKSSSRQNDSTNGEFLSSKSRLQKNNFIGDDSNQNNNQENNSAQRSSSANKNKLQINLSKTPEQQQRKIAYGMQQQQQLQQQQQQKQAIQSIIAKKNENKQIQPQKQLIRKYQHKTKAGCNYNGPKTNQDNFIVYTNVNNKQERYIFAVCDGHGVYGHLCSSFLRRVLPKKIEEALAREINNIENDFIENSLNLAFLQSSKELLESNIDCTFSGSTCVLLLIIGNKMWSANAGDSRAIICSSPDQQDWSFKELSRDHKPDDPDEYRRIIQRGGRVETYRDEYNNPLGPYRVWLREENIPGLAMARSFGDVIASQVGVTCEPEVLPFTINETDRFIILASDGVWEFISNEDVMNHVIPYYKLDDTEQGCQKLVKESNTQWKLNDEVVDDITCILIFLN